MSAAERLGLLRGVEEIREVWTPVIQRWLESPDKWSPQTGGTATEVAMASAPADVKRLLEVIADMKATVEQLLAENMQQKGLVRTPSSSSPEEIAQRWSDLNWPSEVKSGFNNGGAPSVFVKLPGRFDGQVVELGEREGVALAAAPADIASLLVGRTPSKDPKVVGAEIRKLLLGLRDPAHPVDDGPWQHHGTDRLRREALEYAGICWLAPGEMAPACACPWDDGHGANEPRIRMEDMRRRDLELARKNARIEAADWIKAQADGLFAQANAGGCSPADRERLYHEANRVFTVADTLGAPRTTTSGLRVAFDIGGVLTKRPDVFRPLVAALRRGGTEVFVITDMTDQKKAARFVRENGYEIEHQHILTADYTQHGDLCKAVVVKEQGIHLMVDDFAGYAAGVATDTPAVSLLTWPDPRNPYYADGFKTDGSEGTFGRHRRG